MKLVRGIRLPDESREAEKTWKAEGGAREPGYVPGGRHQGFSEGPVEGEDYKLHDGSIVIANVAPGTHTLNLEHESLVCDNGFIWHTDVANEFTVPVQADAVTVAYINCSDQ